MTLRSVRLDVLVVVSALGLLARSGTSSGQESHGALDLPPVQGEEPYEPRGKSTEKQVKERKVIPKKGAEKPPEKPLEKAVVVEESQKAENHAGETAVPESRTSLPAEAGEEAFSEAEKPPNKLVDGSGTDPLPARGTGIIWFGLLFSFLMAVLFLLI